MPRQDLKAYTSVIARIPHELADQVQQYASQHRCRVSELLREGLEMRLDSDVPDRSHGRSRDPGGEGVHEVLQVLNTMGPRLQAVVRETITEVVHKVLPRRVSTQQPNRKGNTSVIPSATPVSPPTRQGITKGVHTDTIEAAHVSGTLLPMGNSLPTSERQARPLTRLAPDEQQQEQHPTAKVIHEVLPHDTADAFDHTLFVEGARCPKGHDDFGRGTSLRYRRGDQDCVTCRRERNERYNAQKREKRLQKAAQPQKG